MHITVRFWHNYIEWGKQTVTLWTVSLCFYACFLMFFIKFKKHVFYLQLNVFNIYGQWLHADDSIMAVKQQPFQGLNEISGTSG